ncbi:MAG: DMT family transporter [SAR324 cluster bacterium]|nr:EamA family transporter [Deltaproteobacteria bacterium]MEC7417823.1 DMT family transporter [SAR324 cluster bacterium]HIF68912.1 DMT family transporter [Candidatus Lambdaproteobacteria bacterium]MAZ75569.1 EamA family transporter [Deltaproteobacteria bacterium]HBI29030.1 EamA family transporter [Deltaproteobacteria bacterium]|tara:strand:+ start:554 stop:1429 length:876 start_codon:yes stop_codon:yes gene_type:complete
MRSVALYAVTVLIWGTSWLAIIYQLGVVDPMVSVAYRFILAAVIMHGLCWVRRQPMRFSRRDHCFLALQGASLFALNYWLFYNAELHIASGLAAVVFSTIIVWNILIGAVWIRHPLDRRVLLGAGLGLCGIALVFWPEVQDFEANETGLYGLGLSIVATILASLGNIASARNQQAGISVLSSNAWAMTYGAGLMVLLALVSGKPFDFMATPLYVGALLYLSVFASVIAFWSYLTLVGEIGPDRAAYATLLFPLVALGLSTVFEDYVWTLPAIIAVCLILGGNLLTLRKPAG